MAGPGQSRTDAGPPGVCALPSLRAGTSSTVTCPDGFGTTVKKTFKSKVCSEYLLE